MLPLCLALLVLPFYVRRIVLRMYAVASTIPLGMLMASVNYSGFSFFFTIKLFSPELTDSPSTPRPGDDQLNIEGFATDLTVGATY